MAYNIGRKVILYNKVLIFVSYHWSVSSYVTKANSGCGSGSPVDRYEVVVKYCAGWGDKVL